MKAKSNSKQVDRNLDRAIQDRKTAQPKRKQSCLLTLKKIDEFLEGIQTLHCLYETQARFKCEGSHLCLI